MQGIKISSYKELLVWQKSTDLAILIYKLTQDFPKEETYGLVSQMRRSSVSVPSHRAEGSVRGSKKEFQHFLKISLGSLSELETQLLISTKLSFLTELNYNKVDVVLIEVRKMLYGLIKKLTTDN